MKFIELTLMDGDKAYFNPQHISFMCDDKTKTLVSMIDGDAEYYVKETAAQIIAKIGGYVG